MAIVGAVMLLITLVALGGYFLYRSLPSTAAGVSANASEAVAAPVDSDEMGALYIRVVGESSTVFVRVPGGDVLLDQELVQGNSVHYRENAQGLEVAIGDPAAVEVYVNGDHQDISDRDAGHSFTLNP
ncbi:RodZ domain-containing protein [Nocardiopsis sp. MG754419]|uniref:RodZ domain-containing protein n=1 Tax=Nocardiopsis sp. MG754419 TaxID=2259865 RepID=UPI001BA5972E|nr:RodZ domain-containing protein [Nocardiopsis sp. MG754419]